ncbi:MAG: VWA domain-containing protein [Burkholderiales bacterium]|nr:VWA domain-containing protein [Burkholderiales bacterium]
MSLGELLQLQWRAPLWWLLALMPFLLIGLARLRKPSWQRYADPPLQPWAVRHGNTIEQQTLLRTLTEWAFWLLLACALAGPRLPLETLSNQPQQTKHDMDVFVALDVSPSMAATDLAPNRLLRAKLKLQDLMPRWHGERIGLIAYSGEAGLLLPLTRDTGAFIPTLEFASETLFEDKGSHLAAALNLALKVALSPNSLPQAGERDLDSLREFRNKRSRAVLLVTDAEASSLSGEAGNTAIAAARALKAAGVSLYVLVSASDTGATLTLNDAPVNSRPDLAGYRALTDITGGTVALLSDNDSDLAALYQRGILALPASRQASDKSLTWREFYIYPLLAALLLLLVNTLSFTRRGKQALVAAVSLAASGAAQADDATWREAHQSYRQGQYLVAQHTYHKLNGFHARMGEGGSAYRRKDFAFAATQFTQALLLAKDAQQRADALFNLGDSYFYAGNRIAAADAFDGVLRLRPNDQHAKENLARVRGTLVLRNAPAPSSAGIPGRRGRGLGKGEADETTPLDMAPSKDEARPMVGAEAMDAEAARRLGQSTAATQLDSDATRSAALKKLDLLTDQRAATLTQSIKQDATREPPPGMPPW